MVGGYGIVGDPQNGIGAVTHGLDIHQRDLSEKQALLAVAGVEFVVGLEEKVGAAVAADGGGDGVDEVGAGGGFIGREQAVVEVVEQAGDGDEARAVECGAGVACELDGTGACGVGWHVEPEVRGRRSEIRV